MTSQPTHQPLPDQPDTQPTPAASPLASGRARWIAGGAVVLALALILWRSLQGTPDPTEQRFLGEATAPIAVTAYVDLHCLECRQFHQEILVPLIEQYVRPGVVRLELAPVFIAGQYSEMALQGLLCAQDQGKYWPYYEGTVSALAQNPRTLNADTFKAVARSTGLNMDEFAICVGRGKYHNAAHELSYVAQQRGVRRVPTLFLNGAPLTTDSYSEGDRFSFSKLQQRLEQARTK